MGKIKCIKAECPICKVTGSIQLFMNNNLEVRYARVRHYSHIDKDSRKPQFSYCKIEDLEALKTLLKSKGISLSVDEAKGGQKLGQGQTDGTHDLEHSENGSIQQNKGGRRLVWFRTLAFQANDPGFKSRRPHQHYFPRASSAVSQMLYSSTYKPRNGENEGSDYSYRVASFNGGNGFRRFCSSGRSRRGRSHPIPHDLSNLGFSTVLC